MNLKEIKIKIKQIRSTLREYLIKNFDDLSFEFVLNKSLKQVKMMPNLQFDDWIISISNKVL